MIFDVINSTTSICKRLDQRSRFSHGIIITLDLFSFVDHLGNVVREEDSPCFYLDEDLYECEDALFDFEGELIKDFSQYENVILQSFQNGYGYFESVGADGNRYFSIIDKNGNFMFDPILKERTYTNEPNRLYGDFYNGEFIADRKSFDLSGNMIFDFNGVVGSDGIFSCSEGIAIADYETLADTTMYITLHGQLIEPMIPQE